jgi:hypothetical protein
MKNHSFTGDENESHHYMIIKFLWKRARVDIVINWRAKCFEWEWRWV